MTTLSITEALLNNYATIIFLVDNFYSKTEFDSTLSDYTTSTQIDDPYYTKSEIDTTVNLYSPSAQILNMFYSKLHIDNTFISSAQTGTRALYYNKTETDNMLLSYSTGSYVDYSFYNKTDTGNLLADKLNNIGDISLPGLLDIGTSGYTNSRIRCNAELNCYTGYAELRAYSSYDMHVNLSTTRTDGGWMYFETNNDDYVQLSGSGNKVNIYKDTSISGNLNVAGRILIDGSHLNVQPKSSTSSETLVFDQSFGTEFGSDSHGINVYGRQGGNSHLKFHNGRSGSACNVLTDGNLNVGSGSSSRIRSHASTT